MQSGKYLRKRPQTAEDLEKELLSDEQLMFNTGSHKRQKIHSLLDNSEGRYGYSS